MRRQEAPRHSIIDLKDPKDGEVRRKLKISSQRLLRRMHLPPHHRKKDVIDPYTGLVESYQGNATPIDPQKLQEKLKERKEGVKRSVYYLTIRLKDQIEFGR